MNIDTVLSENISTKAMIYLTAFTTAVFLGQLSVCRFKSNLKKTVILFASVVLFIEPVILVFCSDNIIAIKGTIYLLILLYSSFSDFEKMKCDDHLHTMILITAFIGIELNAIPNMILSGFFIGGIMLIPSLITKKPIGGADIKLSTASAFLLGLNKGIIGLLIGMVLAVIFNAIKKNRKKGFPMIPYLAVGFMTAFLI